MMERLSAWICEIRMMIPDFIFDKVAELLGTLTASIIIAVITTYIFNRRLEILKVQQHVIELRLEMYDEITAFLKLHDRQISLENDMSHIVDALRDADFDEIFIPEKPIVPYLLTDYTMIHKFQRDLDRLCTRGLYILDDDVLECFVGVKIYFRNYVMFSEILEGYEPYGKKHKVAEIAESVEKIFYQHIAVICGEDYMNLVEKLQQCIHKKRTQLHFEHAGKNLKKVPRRMRLRNKILEQSNLVRCIHNEFILLGIILCQEWGLDPDEEQKEMYHWANYLAKVLGVEE